MDAGPWPAIGLLLSEAGKELGTAFAFSATHALTARHCLALPKASLNRSPLLRFGEHPPLAAEVVAELPDDDLALLRLGQALPDGYAPIPLAGDYPGLARQDVRISGFPAQRAADPDTISAYVIDAHIAPMPSRRRRPSRRGSGPCSNWGWPTAT